MSWNIQKPGDYINGPLTVAGSATITGDLTVDTSTLKVDSANNRVGIGTATPARPLDIVGSFQSSLGWVLVGTPAGLGGATRYIGGASTTDSWYYNGLTGGSQIWAFGESPAMTLNSTGLGVGVTPAVRFDSLVADAAECGRFRAASGWLRIHPYLNATDYCRVQAVNGTNTALIPLTLEGQTVRFNTNGGLAATLDASGRLLVGNTAAFTDLTGSKEVRIGDGGIQTLTVASLPAATATNIARGGVGGLVYVGGFNGTGQYGAIVLWTAASATVVSVINGTGSTITFGVSAGFLQITSSLVLTQVSTSCIRI